MAAVPFARVINNTVVGAGGTGILVEDNASPTLLNNLIAGFDTGIDIDTTSSTTVIGGTLYASNTVNSSNATVGEGSFAVTASTGQQLFVNAATGNYYPATGSPAIDSSINTLQDRDALTTVKEPLGIAPSPIVAPETDGVGQKRVDDPTVATPSGLGQNVFKDRGAIDRADFVGPNAVLINPEDNDQQGRDRDSDLTKVELRADGLDHISIQLVDGLQAIDLVHGAGIDDYSVVPQSLTLSQDGEVLEYDVDYTINYDRTNDVIRFTPLNGRFASDSRYEIRIANEDGYLLTFESGDQVLDGQSFTLEDQEGNVATFEYESGYTLLTQATYTLEVGKQGGAGIADGEIFSVEFEGAVTDFEFDRNGITQPASTVLSYTLNSTQDEIGQLIVTSLQDADIGLASSYLGDGIVLLGSTVDHLLDASTTSLLQAGVPTTAEDGDLISVHIGDETHLFEFDNDDVLDNEDGIVIEFDQSESYEAIADNITDAILDADIGLNPTHYGEGVIHVGGDLTTRIDLTQSNLLLQGRPGTTSGFGMQILSVGGVITGLSDGQSFTISDGRGNSETFEFDDDDAITDGSVAIPFDVDSDQDSIGHAITSAIAGTNLGLNPIYVGVGAIELHGSTTYHNLDLVGTILSQTGVPGATANEPIDFIPTVDFTAEQMAASAASAINVSEVLEEVSAAAVGDSVLVSGLETTTFGNITQILGIRDLAGNPIQANQLDGTVGFTIVLTSGLDYGDAPDPDYPTLSTSGGATHFVIDGYQLGAENDTEPEARANLDATGDTADDGVEFTQMLIRGGIGNVIVTAAGITPALPGYLDAWVDFDHDGDWDADEKVIDSALLQNGSNAISFGIANDASVGTTYARFRLSSEGNLDSTGPAVDGEVEDYQVTIHRSGWQNPAIAEDVNQDGHVSPIDALLVINHLNSMDPSTLGQPLPVPESGNEPPPFLDVDGDNRGCPIDALMVINRISQSINAGAEGEFVPEVLTATSRSSVGGLTVVHDVAENQQQDAERARNSSSPNLVREDWICWMMWCLKLQVMCKRKPMSWMNSLLTCDLSNHCD